MGPGCFFFWTGPSFDFSHFLAVYTACRFSHHPVRLVVDQLPTANEHFAKTTSLPGLTVEHLRPEQCLPGSLADLYSKLKFVAHRADLVRFWLLHDRGGVYLDMDTLTRKPLTSLTGNALLRDERNVHNAIMAMEAGHPLLAAMIEALDDEAQSTFDSYPAVVRLWTRVVEQTRAPDVTFLPLAEYFPVHWKDWERLFQSGDDHDYAAVRRATVLHHYGYFSRKYTSRMDLRWLREHPCPFSEAALAVLNDDGAKPDFAARGDGA